MTESCRVHKALVRVRLRDFWRHRIESFRVDQGLNR